MTKKEILQTTDAFLLDLDGTVYLDGEPIGDAVKTLCKLRSMGKKLVFLTNNSSKTAEQYRLRLSAAALYEKGDFIYTSANAAAEFLSVHYPLKSVYVLATEAVKREFSCAGVQVCEDHPDVCLLAYDTELTFEKICKFNGFLKTGMPYLATHPDDVCPAKGMALPDAGSFLALFERSSGRRPDCIIGKPYPYMADGASRMTGVSKQALCMVGDRAYTDIRFANRSGIKSILVLSGETTEDMLGSLSDKPDLTLSSLNDLIER